MARTPSRFSRHKAEFGAEKAELALQSIDFGKAGPDDRPGLSFIGVEEGDVRHRPQGGARPFMAQGGGIGGGLGNEQAAGGTAEEMKDAPARDRTASGIDGNQGHGFTSALSWAAFAGFSPEAPRPSPRAVCAG